MWDLVGVRGAADILSWPTGMVSSYPRRGLPPPPAARLACGTIWRREADSGEKALAQPRENQVDMPRDVRGPGQGDVGRSPRLCAMPPRRA